MGLQCGRYDTWELNSYWVNEAIAERRCRAPGSCLHCVMAVSMSAVSRADADHDVDGKAGSGRLQQGKDAFVCPIVWIHQNGNVGDLRRNLLEHPKQFRAEARSVADRTGLIVDRRALLRTCDSRRVCDQGGDSGRL